ncbi:DUF6153 family protein [Actinomadura sp. 3N508]|uniref:DUF6153 family protein n=1 Tax=Actinomadura sp. 3N508 TaxID=3375153 RepID=UPI003791A755
MKLPVGLLLLLCVLAMHGFQASPSPREMAGVALAATSPVHDATMSAAENAVPSAAKAVHQPSGRDHPGGQHQEHPGGQVCLAMLVLISFFGAIVALLLRGPVTVARRLLIRVRIPLVGRPPPRPFLHRLSVLRL